MLAPEPVYEARAWKVFGAIVAIVASVVTAGIVWLGRPKRIF